MAHYIDGFVFPLPKSQLDTYKNVVEKVAAIWIAHGALDYKEFIADDLHRTGTRSFIDAVEPKEDEIIIFGWISFESREMRDSANKAVEADPRMEELTLPLFKAPGPNFDPERMS